MEVYALGPSFRPPSTGPEDAGKSAIPAPHSPADAPPANLGRYRVEKLLGQGSFGRVFLACDEQLQRLVAAKVPHRRLVAAAEDAGAYLAEARTVAALDHPYIVPVFDVGCTADHPCFIVSKYIEGLGRRCLAR